MTQTEIRKVLVVSRFYPPMRNARAIQAERVVQAILHKKIDVRVISEASGISNDRPKRYPGLDILRELRAKLNRMISDIGLFSNKPEVAWHGVGNSIDVTLSDGWRPDCVLSMSVPFASHLIGYEVSKKLGVPWAVFMSDPYPVWIAPGPYSKITKLYGMRKKHYAARLLAKCDALLVPTTEMTQQLREVYPALGSVPAVETLHCAPPDHRLKETPESSAIYHVGEVSRERCSDALIDAIKSMSESMEGMRDALVFVGPVANSLRKALSNEAKLGFVRFDPPVDSERSREIMRSAKALLLIEADMHSGPFLPSKLTDYAATRRPILIISNNDSALVRVADGYEGIHCVPHDRQLILKELLSIYSEPGQGSAELAARFSPEEVAARYLQGFELAAQHFSARSGREGSMS